MPTDASSAEPGQRGVVGRDRRRPRLHAPVVGRRRIVVDVEGEGLWVRCPAGKTRADGGEPIGARVEKRVAWPSAQPFEAPAGGKVHAERGDIDGDDARRLVEIEDDWCADAPGALDNRRGVEDERRSEQHVRDGDKCGAIVDGLGDAHRVRAAVVVGGDDHQPIAERGLRAEEIDHRRKIGRRAYDRIARGWWRQRRQHRHVRGGDVLAHADAACGRTDERRDRVTDFPRHRPPPVGPRAHAAGRPRGRVLAQRRIDPARHRAERVGDHVGGRGEDGELGAEGGEIHGLMIADCRLQIYEISQIPICSLQSAICNLQ